MCRRVVVSAVWSGNWGVWLGERVLGRVRGGVGVVLMVGSGWNGFSVAIGPSVA